MSERQGPQTKIRGGVRDRTEHVLDGVDALMDEDLSHRLVVMGTVSAPMGRRLGRVVVQRKFAISSAVLGGRDLLVTGAELRLPFAIAHYDQRLRQQHPRHADQRAEDEQFLEAALARVHVRSLALVLVRGVLVEHHVDESNEDGGRTSGTLGD